MYVWKMGIGGLEFTAMFYTKYTLIQIQKLQVVGLFKIYLGHLILFSNKQHILVMILCTYQNITTQRTTFIIIYYLH